MPGTQRAPVILGIFAAAMICQALPAHALDWLHDQRRERGRVCMIDHYHDGHSQVEPTRKKALAAAIRDWREYTGGEYGDQWGSYTRAVSKRVGCTKQSGGYVCHVVARPCRR